MTKLARFLFGNNEAETITNRQYDGDHWYMASTICALLGIAGYSQAVHNHLEDGEWRKETIYIGGYGKKKVLLVNTIGMLKLIVCGRTPYALKVQERIIQVPSDLKTRNWPERVIKDEQ